ncbi:MAG: MFS transporter [Kiritimatiellae bacterium]|nr:MFS transporter [Kiritimatiellia bacterium]
MKRSLALLPMLAGFFVMGFSDIIGTVMNQVKAECALSDVTAGFLPSMIFVWFFLISIPTGVLCGKIGRKNTVLVSLGVTVFAMLLPLAANAERFWIYFISFALLGIGNTIIQAALPALMSNVVASDQLTSRISLGQFVKAICAALTPVFVYLTATALGNWKLLFPLYGALTVVAAIWLWLTDIPDEREGARAGASAATTSFGSCLAMLKHPYVLAMTVGILFSVGADVGFAVAIPEYLKNVYKVELDKAGMGPTVYFVAKTLAAIGGAALFAKVSAAKCFPWCMGLGILATGGIFFAGTPFVFLACVFVAALATANSFGMCMGLALDKVPEKANEITSLMVMAIVGGGIVTPVLGIVQGSAGATGVVCVLLACLAYLLALGLFAGRASAEKQVVRE